MLAALACAALLLGTDDTRLMAQVERDIAADAEFLGLHRGFVAYLEVHPAIRDAEMAWWDAASSPTLAQAEARLDESLREDAEATALLDGFYDELARDGELREAVEGLQRVELTERGARDFMGEALRMLRAEPDLALRVLNGGAPEDGITDAVRTLTDYLGKNPGLSTELHGLFRRVASAPLGRTRAVPWWQTLAGESGAAKAYAGVVSEVSAQPGKFWAWHQRQVAWAEDAQARDWMRYVYRRARREGIGEVYPRYLRAQFARPERLDATEARFAQEHGGAPAFPPTPAPPRLMALPTEETPRKQDARVPRVPEKPARPTRPEVPRIEMRRPEMRKSGDAYPSGGGPAQKPSSVSPPQR